MNENINYFGTSFAISAHDYILEISGGLSGIKDYGQLDSVLTNIQNDLYYPSFEDKITHLVFSTIKFHMFMDGNKRTSIAIGAAFLNLNNRNYRSEIFITEMENIVLWVAQGLIDKELLQEIISSIIKYNYIEESIKLKIAKL